MIALPEDLYYRLMRTLYGDNKTLEWWVEKQASKYLEDIDNTSPVGRFG